MKKWFSKLTPGQKVTIIVACIAASAAIIAALLQSPEDTEAVQMIIDATQTAEARFTEIAMLATLPPTNMPQPSITPLQASTLLPAITSPPLSMLTTTLVAATCDSFEDGIIGKTRGDETIISEKNGVLNLNVIDQSQNGSAFAAAEANLVEGKRVSEVSYSTTLISYIDNNYGVGGIDFFLEDGQLISLGVGPGSPGLGQIEFSICPTRTSDYSECEHPSFSIPIGVPLNIQVIASNQSMEFYIDKELQQTVPISSPIANIQFYLYGDQRSAFHVTVDDLCIHYSED